MQKFFKQLVSVLIAVGLWTMTRPREEFGGVYGSRTRHHLIESQRSKPIDGDAMKLVAHAGFEPAISSLRGRHPRPLDECAM